MKCERWLNVPALNTEVMLIVKCCSKKKSRKNAESAIANFRATDDFKRPELLMFDRYEVYDTQI